MLFDHEFKPTPLPELKPIRKEDEADSAFLAAIQNLAEILAPEELDRWAVEIQSKLTLGQRFALWRYYLKDFQSHG